MQIKSLGIFRKELKTLSKKYRSLTKDLSGLLQELESNPFQGTPIGRNCYKIRLKINSKNTGKSGGARMIMHLFIENDTITLLAIYDKSEQANITDTEIEHRLKSLDN